MGNDMAIGALAGKLPKTLPAVRITMVENGYTIIRESYPPSSILVATNLDEAMRLARMTFEEKKELETDEAK